MYVHVCMRVYCACMYVWMHVLYASIRVCMYLYVYAIPDFIYKGAFSPA